MDVVPPQPDEAPLLETVEGVHDSRTSEVVRPEPRRCVVARLDVLWMHPPTVVKCVLRIGNDRGDRLPHPFSAPRLLHEHLVRLGENSIGRV